MKHLLGIIGGLFLSLVLGCGPGDESADTSSETSTPFDTDTNTNTPADTESETWTDETTGLVTGRVLLQGQSEHAGITVVIDQLAGFQDTTDLTGAFEIPNVQPGNHTVTASLAGYDELTSAPFTVVAGETVIVPAFTLLEATGGLQGYAYLKDATDHSGTTVTLQGTTHTATTDATGFWTIDNVPASNYTVVASHATYFDEEKSDQEVTGGGSLTVPDISLIRKEKGSILGTVTLNEEVKAEGVTVVATNEASPTTTVSTTTNASGTYHLTNLESGVYRMEAYKSGFQSKTMEEIDVPPDGEVTVDYELNGSPANVLSRVAYVSGGSNNGEVEQEGILGVALEQPLVVQLQDSYGTPIGDRFVTAVVTNAQNGGHVEQQTLLSDAEGKVAFTYLLGGDPGQNRIVVKSNDISESRVIFTAQGVNSCGDGFALDGEQCDDGNQSNEDACLNTCMNATCGDGFVWAAYETCDDGNTVDDDACTNACTSPTCGDNIVNGTDQCDDGNVNNTDDCLNTCLNAVCGDLFIQTGVEVCDDGNGINSDSCVACKEATCGDGFVWTGVEACDDGNQVNDDGCTNACVLPTCGDSIVNGADQCDDGNLTNLDACLNTCLNAVCGDGFIQTGVEVCDDGDNSNQDECLNNCKEATCGDGFTWSGVEACDDGNNLNLDGCSSACSIE